MTLLAVYPLFPAGRPRFPPPLPMHRTKVTMTTMSLPSYASGVSEVPLLGETIGANLRRTIREYGDRDALVEVQTGRRWSYDQFGAESASGPRTVPSGRSRSTRPR